MAPPSHLHLLTWQSAHINAVGIWHDKFERINLNCGDRAENREHIDSLPPPISHCQKSLNPPRVWWSDYNRKLVQGNTHKNLRVFTDWRDNTRYNTTSHSVAASPLTKRGNKSGVCVLWLYRKKKHAERENSSVDYILVDMLGIKAPLTHHVSIKSQANAHMAPDDIPLHTVTSKHPGHLSCSITQSPSAGTLNHTPLIQPYCTAGHFPGNDPSPSLPPSRSLFTSPCLEIQHVFTQTHTQHIKVSPLT